MQQPLQYPLTLNFKIAALAPQISVVRRLRAAKSFISGRS